MPSMVEAVCKAKMGLPCTELLKTKNDGVKAQDYKIMFLTVIRYYTY